MFGPAKSAEEKELAQLKNEARNLYQSMQSHLAGVTCGAKLLRYIRPEFARIDDRFFAVWARIVELDPTAPTCPFGGGPQPSSQGQALQPPTSQNQASQEAPAPSP